MLRSTSTTSTGSAVAAGRSVAASRTTTNVVTTSAVAGDDDASTLRLTSAETSPPPDEDEDEDGRVALLHPFVLASAAFMVLWVFGPFPGSWLTGVPEHDAFIGTVYETLHFDAVFGPTSLITKYNEAGRAPALLHAAPGALWSALAPLQLHPRSREAFGGALHRVGGRVMLAAAATLMVGYAVIDANSLYADMHDFGGHGGGVAEAIDATGVLSSHRLPPFNVVGVRGIASWFIGTGVATAVTAARGDFRSHRRWALRHVGAGLWVAAQRPIYSVFRVLCVGGGALGLVDDAQGAAALADSFYYASYVTTFLFFTSAEWAARGRS